MPRSVLVDEGAQSLVYGVCGSGRSVVWQRWVFVFDGRVEKRVGMRVLLVGSTTSELEDDADDDSPEQKASNETFEWRSILEDHGAGTGN
jgi:hypothetical protein